MARKSIYLRPSEFTALEKMKKTYEKANGSPTDWGTFLLLMLGAVIGAKILESLFGEDDE